MKRTMTVAGQYLAAAFLVALGLSAYGCGDSATVNPEVELSRLTVSPGTLQPGFSAGTTSYRVDLTNNIASVIITAQAAVSGDTVTINGQSTTSRTITLDPAGSTTVVNVVVSESTNNSRTYTVRLVRAGLAGNNSLQSLAVASATLAPAFDANVQSYTVSVANNVGSVNITPTLSDPAATMTVNGQAAVSGQASAIALNGPGSSTTITIIVTAQNGNDKTYLVTVSRGVSANNNLQSLAISQAGLSPSFSAGTVGYTLNVVSAVASVTVTPTLQDTTATMTVNNQSTNSGQARTITLNAAGSSVSSTFINIVVTAQNGTTKAYSVNVMRAALGGNNNLSALSVTPGPLTGFAQNTLNYTVNVASTVTQVNVSATKADATAVMSEDVTAGAGTATGQATIQLGGQGTATVVLIAVTAPNGSSKTYRVTVNRAAPASNNNLSALSVTPGPLAGFAQNTLNYTVNVAADVTSVLVSATKADATAVMSEDVTAGAGTATGQATIQLGGQGTATVVLIAVTAPNGSSKTYRITVNRALPSSNNNLSALTVTPGPLALTFVQNILPYTVNVATGVTSVAVSATKADTNAVISGSLPNSGQANITLGGAGTTTPVSITVTAPNGSSKTYTIDIIRALPAAPSAPASAPDLISADDSCPLLDPPDPTNPDPDGCAPGTSRSDNNTNITTPRFAIPQPGAGLTPNLYVDGNKVGSTFSAGTLQPTSSLSDGPHTITSTVTSTATSLESDKSGGLSVTIDSTAPGGPG
ncbi:MAG: cadherin-like beta sandwich domain-containing protein [Nitrospira sp. BO4]|jgi:hypothetical protein|nr:cadherin-like beta sandwich domain-containing protein [Nitrospira sp. BO4]